MVPPEVVGWRSVTAETDPLPDKMHKALGLCCANANIFAAISCRKFTQKTLQFRVNSNWQIIELTHHEKSDIKRIGLKTLSNQAHVQSSVKCSSLILVIKRPQFSTKSMWRTATAILCFSFEGTIYANRSKIQNSAKCSSVNSYTNKMIIIQHQIYVKDSYVISLFFIWGKQKHETCCKSLWRFEKEGEENVILRWPKSRSLDCGPNIPLQHQRVWHVV